MQEEQLPCSHPGPEFGAALPTEKGASCRLREVPPHDGQDRDFSAAGEKISSSNILPQLSHR
jgi:hypothetical protein